MKYTFNLEKFVTYGKFPNYHHKKVSVISDQLKVHDFETAQAAALKKVEGYLADLYASDMWEVNITEWLQVTQCHFRADILLNSEHNQKSFILHVMGYSKS